VRCGDERLIENRFEAQEFAHRRSRGWCDGETMAMNLIFVDGTTVAVSAIDYQLSEIFDDVEVDVLGSFQYESR
jgi:hypothetical protein